MKWVLFVTIMACGAPPADSKMRPKLHESAAEELVTKVVVHDVQQVRKETDCIRVFLHDMKMQQQQPINDWDQPPFEQYEQGDCKKTMRPIR